MQGTVTTSPPTSRVLSIDVLRGITIALMILVNDPGDWSHVYSQLDHAEWNGFTLTDLVFPNFLFLVGASIILSLQSRIRRGESRRSLALHIIRRSAIILALDLFFNDFPHFHLAHLRVYGVLTRIALCYLCAGLICLFTQRASRLLAIAAALLIGYWALMRFVPVPGFGVPTHDIPLLDPDRNLAAWLDRGFTAFLQRTLHTGRLYQHTRDPEGLLSTLPAIATTLIGSITALWLRRVPHDRCSLTAPIVGSVSSPKPTHEASSRPEAASFAAAGKIPPHFVRTTTTITPTHCTIGLILAGHSKSRRRLTLEPLVPHQQKPLDQLLRPIRRRPGSPPARCLLLAHRHAPLQRNQAGQMAHLPLARLRLQRHHRLLSSPTSSSKSCSGSRSPKTPARPSPHGTGSTSTSSPGNSTNITSVAFALAFVAFCFLPNLLLYRKRIFLKI